MKKNWKKRVSGPGRRGSGWCFMVSLEILQDCVTALGNSKFKNHDAGNSTSFLIDPQNFYMLFLQYHWKFHVFSHHPPPPPPSSICILSGIAHVPPVCSNFAYFKVQMTLGVQLGLDTQRIVHLYMRKI